MLHENKKVTGYDAELLLLKSVYNKFTEHLIVVTRKKLQMLKFFWQFVWNDYIRKFVAYMDGERSMLL